MKNQNLFIFLTAFLLIAQFSFSQKLFDRHDLDTKLYEKITKNLELNNIESIHDNTIFYDLNTNMLEYVLSNDLEFINFKVPFFHNQLLEFSLNRVQVYSEYIEVSRNTERGQVVETYYPDLKTYKITNSNSDLFGVFVFSKNGAKSIFSVNGQTYQISLFNSSEIDIDDIYFITNINKNPVDFNFVCKEGEEYHETEHIDHEPRIEMGLDKCVDITMEIDYYTFQTFDSYQESLEWALEILAVSSIYYSNEIEVDITSTYAEIWETEDPYVEFVEDANSMLYSIRDKWISDPNLSEINRDLVHLFSKRNDTGTGGIAFLNGVGSNWNGYGFSSNLTDDEMYLDLPAPYFFWNIYCFMHEIGHNFGARHTQWCGWPGGPIDNCVDVEEMNIGECENVINNPEAAIGTIMSYCHTWSFQSGGGIVMKFHDLVKATMMDYILPIELNACSNNDIIYGCMDETACNYTSLADLEDDTCIYPDPGFDCFGACLNDSNNNGICDENEDLLSSMIKYEDLTLYPNPAKKYIKLKTDNLLVEFYGLKLFNSLGQLVYQTSWNHNLTIDVSLLPTGSYIAHIESNDKIIKKSIIIQ